MPDEILPQIKRADVATAEDVKNILALSPAKLKKLKKEQDKALAVFRSRGRLNPEELALGRAVELERHHRLTGNKDALAEALAAQGRFQEAIDVAVRPDLKEVLTEKLSAVESNDVNCDCPDHFEENGLFIPNQHIESVNYSVKHKAMTPFIRCRVCKVLNARPAPVHLIEQKEARQKSASGKEITSAEFFRTK